ncbi:MAG: ABC transporter substrate-binding protein [Acidimicrobiia bacterium]
MPGLNGFLLAAEEVNRQGGLLGRPLEVVHVDGTTDGSQIRRAVSEMIGGHGVMAIGGLNDGIFALSPRRGALPRADGGLITFEHSELALTAGPVAEAAGIPVVTTSTLPGLPERVGRHLFMIVSGTDAQASAFAEYAWATLEGRDAWMLVDQAHGYTTLLASHFEQVWTELGGEVQVETYATGDLDITSQLARLGGLDPRPDVLFLAGLPNDGGIILRQIRAMGFMEPVLSADWFDTPYLAAYAGDLTDDLYFGTQAALEDPDVQEFIDDYRGEYGEPPPNAFAILGYDALNLIADAIERAGSEEPGAVRDALAATDEFPALSGAITYRPGEFQPIKPVSIVRVQDGEFSVVEKITPLNRDGA